MFIVLCSWCTREISRFPGEDGISHGICRPCYEKTMEDIRSFLPRKIELVQSPVPGNNTLLEQL